MGPLWFSSMICWRISALVPPHISYCHAWGRVVSVDCDMVAIEVGVEVTTGPHHSQGVELRDSIVLL